MIYANIRKSPKSSQYEESFSQKPAKDIDRTKDICYKKKLSIPRNEQKNIWNCFRRMLFKTFKALKSLESFNRKPQDWLVCTQIQFLHQFNVNSETPFPFFQTEIQRKFQQQFLILFTTFLFIAQHDVIHFQVKAFEIFVRLTKEILRFVGFSWQRWLYKKKKKSLIQSCREKLNFLKAKLAIDFHFLEKLFMIFFFIDKIKLLMFPETSQTNFFPLRLTSFHS